MAYQIASVTVIDAQGGLTLTGNATFASNSAAVIPTTIGTADLIGMIRFNTSTSKLERYNGTSWTSA